jgi:hypothetical protein
VTGTVKRYTARVLAAAAAVAVAVVGVALSGGGGLPRANELAAQADAQRLIASVPLPTGARRSDGEPAGDHGLLAHAPVDVYSFDAHQGSCRLTPVHGRQLVDAHAFWTDAKQYASSVLPYVQYRIADDATDIPLPGSDISDDNPAETDLNLAAAEAFVLPGIVHLLDIRAVVVTVAALADGSAGIRVDAIVTLAPGRPSSEHIPPGATRLLISVQPATGSANTIVVTSPRTIRRAAALLNGLPVASDMDLAGGFPDNFPRGGDLALQMTFLRRTDVRPLAVATVFDPCPGIQLTVNGHSGPALGDANNLLGTASAVLPFSARLAATGINLPAWFSTDW